ncbi:MAG: UDP-N-acetylglucosamine 4,6-dehydratase (inverting) [Methanobacteriota archaeon]|nr:MAG: UDP-N-acetylglucosamine 4,6-dehydratase (inverting) [Euryarchaeota archaeon]
MTAAIDWPSTTVLVTGGTGSFGRKFAEIALKNLEVKKLIVFSRDELKQHQMRTDGFDMPNIRYFIGDVRDTARLHRAFQDVDVVVHAAALKQVPACEYNPIEAVMTNVMGAKNIIDAALDNKVKLVLALSTDKAVNPVNLYGATKLVAEKLFVQANAYRGVGPTLFSCVRYGNVVGSRGSVVPLFKEQKDTGRITVTDERMTRFWITLEQGVRFVISSIEDMKGGEIFVPKIPSMNILNLAKAVAPDCEIERIGIRPGEKVHEVLVSEDEAHHALEFEDRYVVQPMHPWWESDSLPGGAELPDGFRYASNTNKMELSIDDLKKLVQQLGGH